MEIELRLKIWICPVNYASAVGDYKRAQVGGDKETQADKRRWSQVSEGIELEGTSGQHEVELSRRPLPRRKVPEVVINNELLSFARPVKKLKTVESNETAFDDQEMWDDRLGDDDYVGGPTEHTGEEKPSGPFSKKGPYVEWGGSVRSLSKNAMVSYQRLIWIMQCDECLMGNMKCVKNNVHWRCVNCQRNNGRCLFYGGVNAHGAVKLSESCYFYLSCAFDDNADGDFQKGKAEHTSRTSTVRDSPF